MNLSEISIRRPVFTTLLTVSFVVLGLLGYKQLGVQSLPKVDFPTITIEAFFPGSDPETMAATVAVPIEDQIASIAGVTSLTSSSILGKTTITVTFDLNRNIDAAALDVQAALSVAQRKLPADMPTPPSFSKTNPAEKNLLYVSIGSPLLPLSDVFDYADTVLKRQIAQVPGVGRVQIHGMPKFAVRVQVDHEAAAARGMSLDEIRDFIAKSNSGTPAGVLSSDRQNIPLTPNGQMRSAEEYGNLVVAWRNGAPIKLKDVARVIGSVEWLNSASWHADERSVNMSVFRQPDANAIEVAKGVRAVIDRLRPQAPNTVTITPITDRSIPIREAADDVQISLLIAIGLVVLVIFLFLGSLRATVIPAVTLPVSIMGTCAFMYAFGLSLNNISLLAATLAVGFVVDDAIVMLENITRYIEEGMQPFEAAIKGAREISFTILSITISLIAVFIPVFLMSGMVGRVFREFAITMSIAIVISAVVSLTLVPMLCAYGLRAHSETRRGFLIRAFERVFQSWVDAYEWTLDRCIRFRAAMLGVTFLTLAGTIYLFAHMPMSLFPDEDNGIIYAFIEGPTDASHDYMRAHHLQVEAIIRADRAVEDTVHFVHMTESDIVSVKLKPKHQRDHVDSVFKRLREAVAVVPGVKVSFTPMTVMVFSSGPANYEYTLRADNIADLQNVIPGLFDAMSKLPELTDVNTDLKLGPKVDLVIDREKAAIYGISTDRIRQELYSAFGSRVISTIYAKSNSYAVILEALPEFQMHAAHLSRVRIKSASGQVVPLDAVVQVVPSVGPVKVVHTGQRKSASIFFNTASGVPLSKAIEEIRKVEKEANIPPSIETGFQGGAKLFEDVMKGQALLLLAAIFATYVILGILYESFIHPITIIAGLPSAGIGALITLMIFKTDLSLIAMIGILMLIGIVKKNAIMMIDFALERRLAGLSAEAAIREACLLRFRPIMMTTFAAIFGALPIAIGHGAGAELRQPLGIAVVGGLILSQLLTLYITPVVYLYLDRFDRKLKRKLQQPSTANASSIERIGKRPQLIAAE